jgi:hypothetical protein
MADLELRPLRGKDLADLGRALKAAGGTELRKELLRGIREGSKPTIRKVKASAERNLPRRGGLAARVARSKISTRTKLSGSSAGVRIVAQGDMDVEALDAGRLRHPVFGRGGWAEQSVPQGWFSKPIVDDARQIRKGIEEVMQDVADKIERSV